MDALDPVEIVCPYCGETIELMIDASVGSQEYIEDCQVCCRPINVSVWVGDAGQPEVEVWRDDE